jgi:hypothetical protein
MKDSLLELGTSQIRVIERTRFETRNAYKVLVIKVVLGNTHFKDLKEYGSIISHKELKGKIASRFYIMMCFGIISFAVRILMMC